jgi:hypothetical protein
MGLINRLITMLAEAPRAASAKRDHAITRSGMWVTSARPPVNSGVTRRRAIAYRRVSPIQAESRPADPPRRATRQSVKRLADRSPVIPRVNHAIRVSHLN